MVSAADLKIYKSASAGLGGAIDTSALVVSATPNNAFSNVTGAERTAGEDYYMSLFLKNTNSAEAMDNFNFWLDSDSPNSDTTIKWGFDPVANSSIGLDGVNDNIALGDEAGLWSQAKTKFSFSMWIYANAWASGTNADLVRHDATSNGRFTLESIAAGDNLDFTIKNTGGTILHATAATVSIKTWHHVVCTYDNSLGTENMKLYVDKVKVGTANITDTVTLTGGLFIGKGGAANVAFNGYVRDFRYFVNKTLTQTEIDDIYDDSSSAPNPNYWLPMDEGTGNPVDNVSGTKTGVLTDGAFWNVSAQTIADIYTAPSSIDWIPAGPEPSNPNIGKLSPNETVAIWVWWHVEPLATSRIDDPALFAFTFDIPSGGTGSGGGSGGGSPGTYHYEPYGTFSGTETLVAEPTAPDVSPPFSISLWFRTSFDYFNDSPLGFGYMLHKGSFASGTLNFAMAISSDLDPPNHAAEIFFSEAASDTFAAAAGTGLGNGPFVNVIDGQWHHLIGTYNVAGDLKIYLDAFLDHTEDTGGATPPVNNDDMKIGGDTDVPFIGDLDQIRIWDVELTQTEITNLFQNGVVPQESNIVYENTFGGSGSGGGGGTGGNPPPTPTNYKIAFCGDWGCESTTDDVIDLINSEGYDFTWGVGDNSYDGSATCWTSRFQTLKNAGKFDSAFGNHEYSESAGINPYKTFLGHSLTYFSKQIQNMFFLVVDSNIDFSEGSNQHDFIVSELERVKNDSSVLWRVVIMHHPWFGASSDHSYNDDDQVQTFHQLFINNKVNFVFTGHNHNWQETYQVSYNSSSPTSPNIVDNSSPYSRTALGLIHIVTGTGGHDSGSALYSLGSQPSYQAYQNRTHNGVFELVASNNGTTLTGRFRSIDGDTFGEFQIS